ncbi:MAG: TolC family outer membrane protein [Steroidobacteraceae bacterium]|nr:TolC family outer membrane protein [Steroidobacteraceae bacterium]
MKVRNLVHSVLVASAGCLALNAQASDLAEVYQRALQNDPQIREAEANRLAVMEVKPQARSGLLPQVEATAGYTDREADGSSVFVTTNPATGDLAALTRRNEADTESENWEISLRQSIFRWENWATLKRADRQVAQAEVDYQAAQQQLILRTSEAYFNVLAAKDTLTAAEAAHEAFRRQLEQAEKRFEVGLIAITDVQEAKAAFDSATAALILAKRSLANQQEALRELTGEIFDVLARPSDKVQPVAPDPANEDDWVKLAMDQNLELVSARIGADITREDISIQRGGHYPSLDFFVTRSNRDATGTLALIDPITGRSTGPNDSESDDTVYGLQLTVPIYSGGATSSRVREAEYRHRASRERLERVARETERSTRDAYLGVMSEMARVQSLRQAVASSRVALEATEAGYEVGTRTQVDVLDARRRLFEAETNYARSRYDYLINVLRLQRAAGTLEPDRIARINAQLDEPVTLR